MSRRKPKVIELDAGEVMELVEATKGTVLLCFSWAGPQPLGRLWFELIQLLDQTQFRQGPDLIDGNLRRAG